MWCLRSELNFGTSSFLVTASTSSEPIALKMPLYLAGLRTSST
jgi:hypothetical protein